MKRYYGIPGDGSTWKPNCHAHIVWDWMNHETGKLHLERTDIIIAKQKREVGKP